MCSLSTLWNHWCHTLWICRKLFVLAAVCRGKIQPRVKLGLVSDRNIWGSPPFHHPTSKILLFVLHLTFVKILFKSHKIISYCWGQIYLPFMKSTLLLKCIVSTCKLMGNIISTHLNIFIIFSCDYVVILFPKYLSPLCEFLHQI